MLHLIILMIDVVITLICSNLPKVRILTQGGMEMLKHKVRKVKVSLDNWVVKAVLLVLGVWGTHPQP